MIHWSLAVLILLVMLGLLAWLVRHLFTIKNEDTDMRLLFKNAPKPDVCATANGDEALDYYLREQAYMLARVPKCIKIGGYQIWAGGQMFFTPDHIAGYDLLVPLTKFMPFAAGCRYQIFALPLEDFGGVKAGFKQHVQEVVRELVSGKKVIAFCDGGLGRTGTLLASLIALMEPETTDPIAAVRARYREFAIETYAQAQAVFALRGQLPPEQYRILMDVEDLRRSAWSKAKI